MLSETSASQEEDLSSSLTPSIQQSLLMGKSLLCGYSVSVPARKPASEMLKMQLGRVEHSIPICGLLLGNKNTEKLVN